MLRKDKDDLAALGHGVCYLFHDGDPGDEVSGVPAEAVGGGARLQRWEDVLQDKVFGLVVGTDKCIVLKTIICVGGTEVVILPSQSMCYAIASY